MPESNETRSSPPSKKRLFRRISRNLSGRNEVHVLKAYSIIGVVALTIFGLLHIVEGNKLLGYLEIAFAVVIAVNALGFRVIHNMAAARLFFLLSIVIVLLMLVVTGGTRETGIFWLFVFPNLAFFLTGKRQGVGWMVVLGVAVGTVVILSQFDFIEFGYF